jgi:hypothetical protein
MLITSRSRCSYGVGVGMPRDAWMRGEAGWWWCCSSGTGKGTGVRSLSITLSASLRVGADVPFMAASIARILSAFDTREEIAAWVRPPPPVRKLFDVEDPPDEVEATDADRKILLRRTLAFLAFLTGMPSELDVDIDDGAFGVGVFISNLDPTLCGVGVFMSILDPPLCGCSGCRGSTSSTAATPGL